jgi:hypothetical protein
VTKGIDAFYLNSKTRIADLRDRLANTVVYEKKTSGVKTREDMIVDSDVYFTWPGV